MESLLYRKYEQYSPYYIINLDQLKLSLKSIQIQYPNLLSHELETQFDKLIQTSSYYNLISDRIDDFTSKLYHNIALAQTNEDTEYLKYLQTKFKIKEDLLNLDLSTWTYQTQKIKLKLKPTVLALTQIGACRPSPELAAFLDLEPTQTYKYPSDLIRLIHKYIYDHELQKVDAKSEIKAQIPLSDLLLPLEPPETKYTYFNLPKYIQPHIQKIRDSEK